MKGANTRVCPICGAINLAQDQTCLSCGAWLGSAAGGSSAGVPGISSATIPCPHCGQAHPAGTRICPIYARPLTSSADLPAVCLNCGNPLASEATYCGYCGAPVERRPEKSAAWLRIAAVMVAGLVAVLVFITGLYLLFKLLLDTNQPASPDSSPPPTIQPTVPINQPTINLEASATAAPIPTATWTPTPWITNPALATVTQPTGPLIGQSTDCNNLSYLRPGMTAYVHKPIYVYDIPRFQPSSGKPDPVIRARLAPGDQVIILEHESSPYCYHNKTYFWYVQPEKGDKGFAYEFTFVNKARDIVTQPAGDGYYLLPYPP